MSVYVSSTIVLIIRSSKLYYTASGIITPVGGRPVHRLREDCIADGCILCSLASWFVLSQTVHRTATCRV